MIANCLITMWTRQLKEIDNFYINEVYRCEQKHRQD